MNRLRNDQLIRIKIAKAKVKATGQIINVYRVTERMTWCNADDCKTEYQPNELEYMETIKETNMKL